MTFGSKRSFSRRLLTAGLIAALPLLLQPVAAAPLSTVKGAVFSSEQGTPLAGARVHLMQAGTQNVFTSTVTAADGTFDVSGLPVASYEAAVELDGGLYIVETPVVIGDGAQVSLNLAIPQLAQGAKQHRVVKGAAGFMSSPLAATLLVVGSAFSVGALIDAQSNDNGASPF